MTDTTPLECGLVVRRRPAPDRRVVHVGVPAQQHKEFMAIIESYRSMVVGAPAEKQELVDAGV